MANEIEQDKEGFYGLCVFNAENSTDNELREVFGKFGPVAKVRRAKALTFICYTTLKEAQDNYKSMYNHQIFRVRPAKSKNNMNAFNSQCKKEGSDSNQRGGAGDFSTSRNDSSPKRLMPKLVPIIPKPAEDMRKVAKQVMIGNLPRTMNQHTVYDLCTKSKAAPLHIEMRTMNRPPYPTLFYAQVFVRSDKEVKKIIDGLNNLLVNGYKLVVCAGDELVEEGKKLL